MESGGHRSGGGSVSGAGAEGAGGLLCHVCGYHYPNAHPSAKQRRAHRKHCGKQQPGAEEGAGEPSPRGTALFPGEGGGEPAAGVGAGAAECGGGSLGSAREAGSAAVDADNTERSSHDGAGAQVMVDKCVGEHSDVASKVTLPEANSTDDSGTLNEVAAEYSGKASLPEEGVPSVPALAVSSVQLQDVSVPVLQPEQAYGEGVSPELSVSEMQSSNAVSLASDATGGELSKQANDVITEPNGTTVTGVDGTANTIEKDTLSEEISVKGGDLDSSCQESLQTEVGEGHNNTVLEEDSSDKHLSAVQIEDIPNDKPESNQQRSPVLTGPIELVPNIEEPVKSGTQVAVGADVHSEATVTVKPQEQPESTSVEDHLSVPEQADIFEGEHYPNKDGGTETISSAVGPAVNAEVISVGDADTMTKNVYSSDVTMEDSIQENVSGITVVPAQTDLVDPTKSATTHESNVIYGLNDVEEKGQNEKSVVDLTSHEINEVPSHLTNAVCSTDNDVENEKETIAEASSCNIQSTSSTDEEKHIEEFIANLAPEKTDVTNNKEDVEENKQIEVYINTTEAIDEKETISEINSANITDNVEDKKQSEGIDDGDISDGTNMIFSTVNEEKMRNDDMTEDPSPHEKTVVHSTDNAEEKKNEETMVDPTSHSASDSVEERKNGETSADLSSHGKNGAHATEEKKDGEAILEPISSKISTVGGVGDVKEKKQNEETTAGQISGENNTQQSTYAAENGTQNKEATTVLVSDKSEVAEKTGAVEGKEQNAADTGKQNKDATTVQVSDKSQLTEKTGAVEGTEQNNETNAKEISAIQSMDEPKGAEQNEEIADKEVIVDSDRSHVSLKVLLADKNVETKEKKPSTKDRVLSFRRRSSKDTESPVKPGSPTAGSEQQDWNSPARLPVEKKSKGKKQQWVPFICCASIQ